MPVRPGIESALVSGFRFVRQFGTRLFLNAGEEWATRFGYFNLSQSSVRTVFLPVAGSVEGSVVSVRLLPSNL